MTARTFAASAVIFDLDGVLVDSETINVRSAQVALAELGHALPEGATAAIVGRHPIDYVSEITASLDFDDDGRRDLIRRQDEIYRGLWRGDARLMPGARVAIDGLRERRFRLALATSAGRAHARHCLDRFELDDVFEHVVTKEDVARRKPDPEVYFTVVRRLGVDAGDAVVVEDSLHGVSAARAAGLRCLAVRAPHSPPGVADLADAVLDSVGEVGTVLRRSNSGT